MLPQQFGLSLYLRIHSFPHGTDDVEVGGNGLHGCIVLATSKAVSLKKDYSLGCVVLGLKL